MAGDVELAAVVVRLLTVVQGDAEELFRGEAIAGLGLTILHSHALKPPNLGGWYVEMRRRLLHGCCGLTAAAGE